MGFGHILATIIFSVLKYQSTCFYRQHLPFSPATTLFCRLPICSSRLHSPASFSLPNLHSLTTMQLAGITKETTIKHHCRNHHLQPLAVVRAPCSSPSLLLELHQETTTVVGFYSAKHTCTDSSGGCCLLFSLILSFSLKPIIGVCHDHHRAPITGNTMASRPSPSLFSLHLNNLQSLSLSLSLSLSPWFDRKQQRTHHIFLPAGKNTTTHHCYCLQLPSFMGVEGSRTTAITYFHLRCFRGSEAAASSRRRRLCFSGRIRTTAATLLSSPPPLLPPAITLFSCLTSLCFSLSRDAHTSTHMNTETTPP